jgi:hypothetical protein
MKTLISTVTFRRPFMLPGFDRPHAPGTFQVRTDHERLDTITEAWLRTDTALLIVDGGLTQAWPVEPSELEKALRTDREPDFKQ